MTASPRYVEIPTLGCYVAIVDGDQTCPSHVIGVDGMVLTLGLPPGFEEFLPPGPNAFITLRWVGRRGRFTAPGRFVAAESDGRAIWKVEALGTVEVEQGRQVSRAPANGLVHLGPAEPTVGVVLRGRLVDISEGGMRCQLAGGGVDPGQQVSVRLVLEERLLAVRGTVVRMEAGAVEGGVEVAVAFEPDEAQAQLIRRYVLHRQVRDRAVGAVRLPGEETDSELTLADETMPAAEDAVEELGR
ncbi:MAG: PilZ domain-containing protein [Actinobacteria bacterium]|nr:PilZ domain-containing protein [Actinomycetota bacterium]